MNARYRRLLACSLLGWVTLVPGAGCAGSLPASPERTSRQQPASVVFDSRYQRELAERRWGEPAEHEEPWYADRRDLQPTVAAGKKYPVVERSVKLTVDRQRIISGRVRDYHRTTIYSRELRKSVR